MTVAQLFSKLYPILAAMFFSAIIVFVTPAYMLKGSQTKWRGIKLAAAVFGSISLAISVLAFERNSRSSFLAKAERDAPYHLADLRFMLTREMSRNCSSADRALDNGNTCFDLERYDAAAANSIYSHPRRITPPVNFAKNEVISKIQKDVDYKISSINSGFDFINREEETFDFETYQKITLFALLVLIISAAATVGEATFQYRTAKMDEDRKKLESSAKS